VSHRNPNLSGGNFLPKIRRAAAVLARWQGPILLLAAPFFLFPSPARAPFLLVLPGLWLAAWLAGDDPLPRTPLNASLLLFSLMLLVSLWTTFDLTLSLPKIAGVLLGLGAYFAIVRLVRGPAALWWALALFILSGAGLVALGLIGIDWLNKLPVLSAITQRLPAVIRGLPGAEEGFSANGVAGALIFILPLQVVLIVTALRRWPHLPAHDPLAARPRLWLAAQVALALFAGSLVLLSQSRGAWLGFGAALALILAGSGRRARWLRAGGAVLVILALLLAVGPLQKLDLVGRILGADVGSKLADRQTLWYYGLLVVRDLPFTGMGLNVFRKALPVLYPTVPLPTGFDITHAHNHLLQAAVNFGLPGLVAYLGLWFGAAYALWSAHRASVDPWLRAVALGLAAGLLAEFVYGTSDVIDFGAKLGIFFWVTLALSMAVYHATHEA